jgi:hypothetical protein
MGAVPNLEGENLMSKVLTDTIAELRPMKVQSTELVPVTNLKTALEHEIAYHCRGKVTKRVALKLALAVISEAKGGMFYADRLATRLQVRLRYEAALKEIYLERQAK